MQKQFFDRIYIEKYPIKKLPIGRILKKYGKQQKRWIMTLLFILRLIYILKYIYNKIFYHLYVFLLNSYYSNYNWIGQCHQRVCKKFCVNGNITLSWNMITRVFEQALHSDKIIK